MCIKVITYHDGGIERDNIFISRSTNMFDATLEVGSYYEKDETVREFRVVGWRGIMSTVGMTKILYSAMDNK